MPQQQQATYLDIEAKVRVIAERQQMLVDAVKLAQQQRDDMVRQVKSLTAEVERLKADAQYRLMADAFAVTPDGIANARALIAELIRDIDRCISEVKAT